MSPPPATKVVEGDRKGRGYRRATIAHNTLVFPDSSRNDEGGRRVFSEQDIRSMAAYNSAQECHTGRIAAYEEQGRFVHVASDVTPAYPAGMVRSFHRRLVFVDRTYLIVYDRVEGIAPGRRATWLLHSPGEPDIKKNVFTVTDGAGKLQVATLLPANAVVTAVGGPGREFWSEGKNWPAPVMGENVPGAWRVEVTPPAGVPAQVFLHVLAPRGTLPPCALIPEQGGGVAIGGAKVIFAGDGLKVTMQ
ncbi:MAG: heparinase II/III family protein [Planctomycetota bacterium]